jgi:hypothetical protein
MTEQKFRSEMRRAEAMRKTCDDPHMALYWAGYIRGLRRAYHGKKFGTPEEHALWLAAATSEDKSRKQRGRGYRDGLAYGDISSRMGAPNRVGDDPVTLAPLRVSTRLKVAIEETAAERGIDVSEARRQALEQFVGGTETISSAQSARDFFDTHGHMPEPIGEPHSAYEARMRAEEGQRNSNKKNSSA